MSRSNQSMWLRRGAGLAALAFAACVPTSGPARAQEPVPCTLADSSGVVLSTALGDLGPLDLRGVVNITCGEGSERACACETDFIDPIEVPGVGYVCLAGAEGCPGGVHTCEGGLPLNVDLYGDRIIGECNANNVCTGDCNGDLNVAINEMVTGVNIALGNQPLDDCTNFDTNNDGQVGISEALGAVGYGLNGCNPCGPQCDAYCADRGMMPTLSGRGCEGYCNASESPCEDDLQCVALEEGSCNGQDGFPLGNICECQCLQRDGGDPGPAGTFSCTLGSYLVVEQAAPCDGADVLIDVGSQCIPLTSETATGIIVNAQGVPGSELSPQEPSGPGAPLACSEYDSGSVSGLGLRGSVIYFGSTIGDILTSLSAECE